MPQAEKSNNIEFDPLVRVAAEIKKLGERFNDLDGRPQAIGIEETYRDAEKEDLQDRLLILRSYLTVCQAKSIPGVLAQCVEASNLTDLLANRTANEEDHLRLRRLFASMNRFLESSVSPELTSRMPLSEPHLDPWVPYEEQIRVVESRKHAEPLRRAA